MPAKPKRPCDCGCEQAPAKTTRLRKISCHCGRSILRLSRQGLALISAECRECGSSLEPACLFDRMAAGDDCSQELGRMMAAEAVSAVARDNARKRGIRQMRCANCAYFRPFGANHDPTAEPDPCPRCGSTEPVTFGESRTVSEPDAIPF